MVGKGLTYRVHPLGEELAESMQELRVDYQRATPRQPRAGTATRPVTSTNLPARSTTDVRVEDLQMTPLTVGNRTSWRTDPAREAQAAGWVWPSSTPPRPPTAMVAPLVGIQQKHSSKRSRNAPGNVPFSRQASSDRSRSTTPNSDEKTCLRSPPHGGSSQARIDIEKWKALVDMKDRIISQKNQLIER